MKRTIHYATWGSGADYEGAKQALGYTRPVSDAPTAGPGRVLRKDAFSNGRIAIDVTETEYGGGR